MAAVVLTPAFYSQATENALATTAIWCMYLERAAVGRESRGLGTNVTLGCIVGGARAAYHAFHKVTRRIYPPSGRGGLCFHCELSHVMPYCNQHATARLLSVDAHASLSVEDSRAVELRQPSEATMNRLSRLVSISALSLLGSVISAQGA